MALTPAMAAALPSMITAGGNIISSGISGGASLLNGIIGSFSQKSANDTNVMLARESRDWQSAENEKARQFQKDMWNLQNEYNSPANQMALYQKAGINPLLIGQNNGPSSAAGSSGTPSMTSSPNVPHVAPINPMQGFPDAFNQILSAMGNNMQVLSNQKLQSAQAVKTLVDAATDAYDKFGKKGYDEMMKTISPLLSQINLEGSRSDVLFAEQLKNNLSQRYNLDMDSLNKEIQYNLGKKYGEQQIQANLSKLSYDISEIVGRLNTMRVQNDALIQQTAADLVVKGAQAFKLIKEGDKFKADAETANQLRQYLVKTAKYEMEVRGVDAYFASAHQDSSSDLVGFMTSKEGREAISKSYQLDTSYSSDTQYRFLRAIDDELSKFVHVGIGFNYSKGDMNVNSRSHSTGYSQHENVTPVAPWTRVTGF